MQDHIFVRQTIMISQLTKEGCISIQEDDLSLGHHGGNDQ